MMISLFDMLAPHYCCSCGEIGRIICDNCKNNIISRASQRCLLCAKTIRNSSSLCQHCQPRAPFENAWYVGERSGALKLLIGAYKFERVGGAYREIVDLLDTRVSELPAGTIVVPVPTIASHVRQRGFDHAARLAKEFARRRKLPYRTILHRRTSSVQHTADKSERWQQAKQAFVCDSSEAASCLLIDDIYTTGATLHYAAKALLASGFEKVSVAVVARQPTQGS